MLYNYTKKTVFTRERFGVLASFQLILGESRIYITAKEYIITNKSYDNKTKSRTNKIK